MTEEVSFVSERDLDGVVAYRLSLHPSLSPSEGSISAVSDDRNVFHWSHKGQRFFHFPCLLRPRGLSDGRAGVEVLGSEGFKALSKDSSTFPAP